MAKRTILKVTTWCPTCLVQRDELEITPCAMAIVGIGVEWLEDKHETKQCVDCKAQYTLDLIGDDVAVSNVETKRVLTKVATRKS